MKISLKMHSEADLPQTAKELLDFAKNTRHWLFRGEMGAGKTTLIKSLLAELGAADEGSSPTYSLVNEYQLPDGSRVFHFDLYRIRGMEEALDFGMEEYLDSDERCFIEWPEKILPLLREPYLDIHIRSEGQSRLLDAILTEPAKQ